MLTGGCKCYSRDYEWTQLTSVNRSRAEKAIAAWKRVISREGHSKFPLARMGLALAPELLAHAEEAVAQEESSDSS